MTLTELRDDMAKMHPDDRAFARYSKCEVLACIDEAYANERRILDMLAESQRRTIAVAQRQNGEITCETK